MFRKAINSEISFASPWRQLSLLYILFQLQHYSLLGWNVAEDMIRLKNNGNILSCCHTQDIFTTRVTSKEFTHIINLRKKIRNENSIKHIICVIWMRAVHPTLGAKSLTSKVQRVSRPQNTVKNELLIINIKAFWAYKLSFELPSVHVEISKMTPLRFWVILKHLFRDLFNLLFLAEIQFPFQISVV